MQFLYIVRVLPRKFSMNPAGGQTDAFVFEVRLALSETDVPLYTVDKSLA